MHNALDVGQANLEGVVVVLLIAIGIQTACQFRRDQTFAVKLQHIHIHGLFNARVFADRFFAAVILDGDDGNFFHDTARIIYDDDVIRVHAKKPLIDCPAAGKHQAVVGVELGELTLPDLHAQGHALPHGVVKIGADEGELVFPAHAGRSLERHEAGRPSVKGKLDPLRPKEQFRLFLQFLHQSGRRAVEDAGEVQHHKVRQQLVPVGHQDVFLVYSGQGEKLMEQGAIVLRNLLHQGLIRLICRIKIEAPAVLGLPGEVQNRPRGDVEDVILLQFHAFGLLPVWIRL